MGKIGYSSGDLGGHESESDNLDVDPTLYSPQVLENLKDLNSAFPDVDVNTLVRFAKNSTADGQGSPVEMYTNYLAWRETFPRYSDHDLVFRPQIPNFPRRWCQRGGLAADGSHIIFVQGAAYDTTVATVENYVERCCHVCDELIPDDSFPGQICILIDCRPYKGMKNPPATKMLTFFKLVATVISNNYPGRISKVVIYPIPRIITGLINVILRMFNRDTREKLNFISGSGSIGSKCPTKFWNYVDDAVQLPEATRQWHVKEK